MGSIALSRDRVECVVVGAGVVGLACAASLAAKGHEVLVIEAENAIGTQTSSRNSEVIHAGLYYAPGSLKARLCRRGRERLYAFARDRGIPHRQTGKLIVANGESQIDRLCRLAENAAANDVMDLVSLTKGDVAQMEPEIRCDSALLSPSTGIIDSHGLMLALQAELELHGGMVVCRTRARGARLSNDRMVVAVEGEQGMHLETRFLVNCAGLKAPTFARSIEGLPGRSIPPEHFAAGHYYKLVGPSPCSRLVYPLPEPGGLGIHLTIDMGGQARFGPDVRWLDRPDYAFDDSRRDAFAAAIRSYLPAITRDRLQPDYTGIRPKISGPGEEAVDFAIHGPAEHGVPGLVNLFGIESPGLTAALEIGELVSDLVSRRQ